jgi:hypothetical protein
MYVTHVQVPKKESSQASTPQAFSAAICITFGTGTSTQHHEPMKK